MYIFRQYMYSLTVPETNIIKSENIFFVTSYIKLENNNTGIVK